MVRVSTHNRGPTLAFYWNLNTCILHLVSAIVPKELAIVLSLVLATCCTWQVKHLGVLPSPNKSMICSFRCKRNWQNDIHRIFLCLQLSHAPLRLTIFRFAGAWLFSIIYIIIYTAAAKMPQSSVEI